MRRLYSTASGSFVIRRSCGFTLLEVIVTLTVGAVLMAVIVPYLGTALSKSGTPLIQLKSALSAYQTMENITADYRRQQADNTLDLVALRTAIGSEGSDRSNAFGTYRVLVNRFIIFDASGQEAAPGSNQNILKVTLATQGPGPQFTTLFTRDLP